MLHIGGLCTFGLGLEGLLRAEQAGLVHPAAKSKKSVILVWMHGGPSQLETFDMKPDAPAEVRGEFAPIGTNVPGIDICELLPEHAKVMDKCTVIRSFSHGNADHWAAAHWTLTGRLGANGNDRMARYPSMGAVAAKLLGPTQPGSLASVNMNDGGFGFHGAAWLGVNYNPLQYGDFSYGNEAGRLPAGDTQVGYPARPEQEQLRILMATAKLPEMRKTLRDLEMRVEELDRLIEQLSHTNTP